MAQVWRASQSVCPGSVRHGKLWGECPHRHFVASQCQRLARDQRRAKDLGLASSQLRISPTTGAQSLHCDEQCCTACSKRAVTDARTITDTVASSLTSRRSSDPCAGARLIRGGPHCMHVVLGNHRAVLTFGISYVRTSLVSLGSAIPAVRGLLAVQFCQLTSLMRMNEDSPSTQSVYGLGCQNRLRSFRLMHCSKI